MASRKQVRLVAPAALAAGLVALLLLVVLTDGRNKATHVSSVAAASSAKPRAFYGKRVYIVHTGDTASGISVKTGVSLAEIERLNPQLDPRAMAPGTRLHLRQ